MKKRTLQFLTGVALVSAGVWAGSTFTGNESGRSSGNKSPAISRPEFSGAASARLSGSGEPRAAHTSDLAKRAFAKGSALEWLRSQNSLADISALEEILGKFSAAEFAELNEALLQEIMDASRPEHKRRFAIRLLQSVWLSWVRVDPDATITSMTGKDAGKMALEGGAVEGVFRRYARQDTNAAIAAIDLLPERFRKSAGHGVMMEVAARDPFAAIELIPRLGKNASSDPRSIVDAAVERDPRRAATTAGPVSGDAPQDNTFLRAMEKWMEADPAAASAWMDSYQGPGRATGMSAVLSHQAKTDAPGAAARLLKLENPEQSPYSERLTVRITEALVAASGPQSALEWAAGLPGKLGERATSSAATAWVRQDASAASQWIASQPAGPGRDYAAMALVESLARSDPSSAWAWAGSVASPEMRIKALNGVRRAWLKDDPVSAQAAMQSLDENSRKQIELQ